MRILIIDDSKAVHAFVTGCLEGTDIEIDHAYNGKEGVEKYSANPGSYHLILLDWEMPIMTGPEAFNELKNKSINIPVMMMTTKSSVEDISQMINAGVNEYLMKPFTQDILLEKINFVTGVSSTSAA